MNTKINISRVTSPLSAIALELTGRNPHSQHHNQDPYFQKAQLHQTAERENQSQDEEPETYYTTASSTHDNTYDHSHVPSIILRGTEKRERATRNRKENNNTYAERERERLVDCVKPGTPTLVVVSDDRERENGPSANTNSTEKLSIAERRRARKKKQDGLPPSSTSPTLTAGPGASVDDRRTLGAAERRIVHGHRKSERVIVESV